MVFKKILKFLCCFIVWIRDFIKIFCKTMVFFSKKVRYLKSKISTKFHRLIFRLYFFSILAFCFLSHLSKLVQKLWNFWSVLLEGLEFYQWFLENSKSSLKNILVCEIIFFFKILRFTIYFFIFIFTFYFQFRVFVLAFCFFISPIQTCLKIMKFFEIFFWKGKRFYQRFLENSKSSFTNNIDMWNKFCFKIQRFTICFLIFFIIFDILFSISSICCTYQKILEIFMFFYFMD